MSEKKHVSVPKEFFVKAKNDYADWLFAFFREINQNSGDAGATRIEYTITALENGGCQVVVQDNGSGMTVEICESKFLALRQSTKEAGSGSTGAFGVAKEIIVFAHDSYILECHDYKVVGEGGCYQIFPGDEYIDGVRITVVMKDISIERMESRLKNWTSMSNFDCQVILNGTVLEQSNIKYPHTFTVDFGRISFREIKDASYHYSKLIVKMNGMAMFSRDTYTSGGAFEAVLDLNGNSQDRLTSNRDGLTGNLESSLNQILNQLSNDRTKLTLGEPLIFELNADYEQQYEHIQHSEQDGDQDDDEGEPEIPTEKKTLSQELEHILSLPGRFRPKNEPDNEFTENLSRLLMKREHEKLESTQEKIQSAIDQVDEGSAFPQNWLVRVSASENKAMYSRVKSLKKLKYARLAYMWQFTVRFVLKNGVDYVDQESNGNLSYFGKNIRCGFILDSAKALCVSESDCHQILINPHMDYDLYMEDFETLVSRAVHEVTHMIVDDHGEHYVEVYEEIYVKLRKSLRESSRFRSFNGLKRQLNEFLPTYNR